MEQYAIKGGNPFDEKIVVKELLADMRAHKN